MDLFSIYALNLKALYKMDFQIYLSKALDKIDIFSTIDAIKNTPSRTPPETPEIASTTPPKIKIRAPLALFEPLVAVWGFRKLGYLWGTFADQFFC